MPTPIVYRPGKSAIDAVRRVRQALAPRLGARFDIKAYFDSIDWELMLRAVRRHTNDRGCCSTSSLLKARCRWRMAASSAMPGTPQGGVISPTGEFVSALCVRHVDGEKVSSHPETKGRVP